MRKFLTVALLLLACAYTARAQDELSKPLDDLSRAVIRLYDWRKTPEAELFAVWLVEAEKVEVMVKGALPDGYDSGRAAVQFDCRDTNDRLDEVVRELRALLRTEGMRRGRAILTEETHKFAWAVQGFKARVKCVRLG